MLCREDSRARVWLVIWFRGCQLLLPAAAEGLIELNECKEFVGLGLGKIKLGREVVGLVGENFEVTGR